MTRPLTRTAALEVDTEALETRAAGDDRVPVAISSEFPVERTDWTTGRPYLEVLEHSRGAVDLSRAARGLPLLAAHDAGDLYGVVEELRLGRDRKLRGFIRWSRSAKAQEVRRDVADGIRTAVSIGYRTGDTFTSTIGADGKETRRFTSWMPYEVSTVTIPADPTVGINRAAASPGPAVHFHRSDMPPETNTTPPASREAEFMAIAATAGRTAAELADDMSRYTTADDYARAMLEQLAGHRSVRSPGIPPLRVDSGFLDGFAEAVFAPDGSAAREATRKLSRELGLPARGSLVPLQVRTITSTGVGSGKEFSPVVQGDFVDLMRPRLITSEFGAQIESYQGGTVSRPTLTSDAAFSWLAENPGAGVGASSPGTSAITMMPRAVATRTTHTAQSLRTSTPETAAMIMDAHAARLAVAVDAAALAGPGTGNQPTGILYTPGVGLVAMGTNGAPVSYAKLCEMEQAVDLANAPIQGLGFVTTPQLRSRMRQTMDFPSAAAGRPLWDFSNAVLGHRALTSTSMPSTLTKGTANGVCHAAILGDFAQLVIAYWGALEVIVDPYTDAAKGLTHITTTLYVDVGILQPGAFAVIRDLTLS